MDDPTSDPARAFFTAEELDDTLPILYSTLSLLPDTLTSEAPETEIQAFIRGITEDAIKKAYRKQALRWHPDKALRGADDEKKKEVEEKWKKIGFAYSVLSDPARKERYDTTNSTSELAFEAPEMGWDAYFAAVFRKVDKGMLDEDKKRYQGSTDELEDLEAAYNLTSGSLAEMMNHIPHSTHADEERFIDLIEQAISSKRLKRTSEWTKTSKDERGRNDRKKKAAKEAKEAEEAAKELGVWEDFYGSQSTHSKKSSKTNGVGAGTSRGKTKRKVQDPDEDEEDEGADAAESALAAMIAKRNHSRENAFDAMLAKYAKAEAYGGKGAKSKGKKSKGEETDENMPTDAEFETLQRKMFGGDGDGNKKASSGKSISDRKSKKTRK